MKRDKQQQFLLKRVDFALQKDKVSLIYDLQAILSHAKRHYRTDVFDFWLKMLREIKPEDIALTTFGHKAAIASISRARCLNIRGFLNGVATACEHLLTYSSEHLVCEQKTAFHFYFNIPAGAVYKVLSLIHI